MTLVTTRRRFVEIVPLGGAALLAACSKAPDPAPAAPPPAQAPAPPAAKADTAAPPVASAAPAAPSTPAAPAAPAATAMVSETDPQAAALGYVADASRADKARFPAFVAGSHCGNCALFLGKAGGTAGPCPLFPGKAVAAAGWCGSWAKKA